MARKIFLTGGGGFLGGNIIREAGRDVEIISVDTREQKYTKKNLKSLVQDLTDETELKRILGEYRPEVIIHTAAVSDIDYCEANRDIAEKVNIGVTRTLADYCKKNDVKMIQFSSDSVFDGRKGNYVEEDEPQPLHYYGMTKFLERKL